MVLESLGIASDSALDGPLSIQVVTDRQKIVSLGLSKQYKLILMDYSMPEMTGCEAAE